MERQRFRKHHSSAEHRCARRQAPAPSSGSITDGITEGNASPDDDIGGSRPTNWFLARIIRARRSPSAQPRRPHRRLGTEGASRTT
ncbi:unnamed protein product [Tilletia controversa]|uniref:Uncharacterized protein n=2 Tax=Tilletia TaxID=13289 RepID=A0A9N8M1G3_9BASI|nr:hypothetical protein CF335_g7530 [Tilletia laevis]KAE8243310.1 hypothetical protein A4X03_0g7799 [Tilletia caries]CAD6934486.1 unnamed protein product [Tilletia controversa]CAD6924411.1 unnamed protein product [Tilletia caries]CAD6953630.1 unnamed protein product [Tilletia laevis]